MKYALGHSFNLRHVFENFPFKKLKTPYTIFKNVVHSCNKIDLCIAIFTTHLKMVLEDVINNDVTFKLPTSGRPSEIRMITYEDDAFILARKNGKFKEVDFLNSNFKGNQIGLFMYGSGRTRVKPLHIDKELKNQLTELTNSGHNYA